MGAPTTRKSPPCTETVRGLVPTSAPDAGRPSAVAIVHADWEFTSEAVPEPGPGQFMVEVSHLSIDPAMRGWMNAGRSYVPPVEVGAVMRAGAVGLVAASEHPGFAVG